MELPFPILSRDAICFEETSNEEFVILWALTRNLVVHAVPFRQASRNSSIFASLPSREACDGTAIRPPSGSTYPSCSAWITPQDLVIGYEAGKVCIYSHPLLLPMSLISTYLFDRNWINTSPPFSSLSSSLTTASTSENPKTTCRQGCLRSRSSRISANHYRHHRISTD